MEDSIEKIKEYKALLALTAIGLLLGGIFFSSTSVMHPPYRIFIRLLVQLRAKVQTNGFQEEKDGSSVSQFF